MQKEAVVYPTVPERNAFFDHKFKGGMGELKGSLKCIYSYVREVCPQTQPTGAGAVSAVKSPDCSSRGLGWSPSNPHSGSPLTVTSIPRASDAFFWPSRVSGMEVAHRHICRQNIYTYKRHKIKNLKGNLLYNPNYYIIEEKKSIKKKKTKNNGHLRLGGQHD